MEQQVFLSSEGDEKEKVKNESCSAADAAEDVNKSETHDGLADKVDDNLVNSVSNESSRRSCNLTQNEVKCAADAAEDVNKSETDDDLADKVDDDLVNSDEASTRSCNLTENETPVNAAVDDRCSSVEDEVFQDSVDTSPSQETLRKSATEQSQLPDSGFSDSDKEVRWSSSDLDPADKGDHRINVANDIIRTAYRESVDKEMDQRIDKFNMEIKQEFFTSTTCHGLVKAYHSPNRYIKWFWIVAVCTAFAGLISQVYKLLYDYYEKPVNTIVQIQYTDAMPFPAVTICNFNRFRQSYLDENNVTARQLRYFNEIFNIFPVSLLEFNQTETESLQQWIDGLNVTKFIRESAHQCESFVVSCWFAGTEFNCCEDAEAAITEIGVCWTLGVNGAEDSSRHSRFEQTFPSTGAGMTVLLNLQLYEYTDFYIPGASMDLGAKVNLHEPNAPTSVDSQGVALLPGMHAYVELVTEKLEFLHVDNWGKCAEHPVKYDKKYSFEACINEAINEIIEHECGCTMVMYPGNLRTCLPNDTIQCVQVKVASTALLHIGKLADDYSCTSACNMLYYTSSVSYAMLPKRNVFADIVNAWDVNVSASYLKENLVMVDLYFNSLDYVQLEERRATTGVQTLSDIGGQLGLFIGASIITLFEALAFLLAMLYYNFVWPFRQQAKQRALASDARTAETELNSPSPISL